MGEGPMVVLRGGGDLGTGAGLRLHRAGCRVVILEASQPTMIRQAVAFGTAVYDDAVTVEGVTARRVPLDADLDPVWARGEVPVMVDPAKALLARLRADAARRDAARLDAMVDAVMAKRNTGTRLSDAPVVVALGPGFTAGVDCGAVVETNRGHNLGRVYYAGSAEADTRQPGVIAGRSAQRVSRASRDGVFHALKSIGDRVAEGDTIGRVEDAFVVAQIGGVLRGVLRDGLTVQAGLKIADVDPRGEVSYCFTVSDKAWAVGGGVVEAVLYLARAGIR